MVVNTFVTSAGQAGYRLRLSERGRKREGEREGREGEGGRREREHNKYW